MWHLNDLIIKHDFSLTHVYLTISRIFLDFFFRQNSCVSLPQHDIRAFFLLDNQSWDETQFIFCRWHTFELTFHPSEPQLGWLPPLPQFISLVLYTRHSVSQNWLTMSSCSSIAAVTQPCITVWIWRAGWHYGRKQQPGINLLRAVITIITCVCH